MALYGWIELGLLGVLVASLFGVPQPFGKYVAGLLYILLVVLAVVGRHA